MVTPKLHRMVAGALQREIRTFAYFCVFGCLCVHVVLWRERLRWVRD